MARFQIPAEARRALEKLARQKRERLPSPSQKRLARQRAERERELCEQALAAAHRVMAWAKQFAATGALAGLGDVVILRDHEGRTTTTVKVNGNGEVFLCGYSYAGGYAGGSSCRCTTAEELAQNFVPWEIHKSSPHVRVSAERIEAAIASGEVWTHLARAVTLR